MAASVHSLRGVHPATMKKLINNPDAVAAETVEGYVLAYSRYVRKVEGAQGVIRRLAPVKGQVAVITGGGSGHEPMFLGYVGQGMAHGSVAGNIFTSPPPQPIYETAKAAHSGSGVLFLYGNYAGDVLNFDIAAEMLADDGIRVATVRISDDVASASAERSKERRGIAGDLFVIKVAGACAEERASLAEVESSASKANDNVRSMGVALSSCIIPASGRPIFEIAEDELEIGLGLHGEPGVERSKMLSADDVAAHLIRRLLSDMNLQSGDEVGILVNGLGTTPLSELLIIYRAASRLLADAGVIPVCTCVGNYATSLDMAGCSITLMRLDPQLKRWLLAPADTPAFVQV
jgi:phosphoenolpyruvate---glycerone phosphotransferase subunit DhaK